MSVNYLPYFSLFFIILLRSGINYERLINKLNVNKLRSILHVRVR